MNIPEIITDNDRINKVYEIAVDDIRRNIKLYRDGLLRESSAVIMAGEGYCTPWTRDAAINVWNGCGLLFPEESKNTLLSVLVEENGVKRIGGEYWDAIVWVTGAYAYYNYSGDTDFYALFREVTVNSLKYFEETEYDDKLCLFRGAACYGDGISAYPDFYAQKSKCGIVEFAEHFPEYRAKKGVGVPMHVLSTNCLYYNAYKIAYKITGEESYALKAECIKKSVNKHFWNEKTGTYDYIVDDFGGSRAAEGLGLSFAILFEIAEPWQIASILKNVYIAPQGIPCLYPNFERYKKYGKYGIGRHCGTIWPQIQAFWADACAKYDFSRTESETECLIANVLRDGYFSEIYHPQTGERYGGVQEWQGEIVDTWKSEKHQTWCATGYIRMLLFDFLGLKFTEKGLFITPAKSRLCNSFELKGLKWRGKRIDICVQDYAKSAYVSADEGGEITLKL